MNTRFRHFGSLAVALAVISGTPIWAAQPLSASSGGDTKTLPPKEAAKACLTTASEMIRNGYRREAISLYERARQLDPSQTQVCRFLAVLYDEVGADREALTEYSRSLQLTPKDADLLNDLGCYYLHRGDLAKAEQWFRAAIAQSPQHERAWVNLGMSLGQQGRFQESFEAFSKVMSPASAHSNVGMLLVKRGLRNEAMGAFRQSLALEPGLKQPRAALACLEAPQNAVQTSTASASAATIVR